MFDVEEEYLEMAQDQDGSISKAVQAMETQLQNVDIPDDGVYRGTTDNIIVEVREVIAEEFQRGIGFGSFYTEESVKATDEIVMVLENSEAVANARSKASALIVLPLQLIEDIGLSIGKYIIYYSENIQCIASTGATLDNFSTSLYCVSV